MMTATTTVERITPTKAKQMLAENTANRPVRKWWVSALARIITEGRWRVTHQGIAINCDGTLLDGQHRLLAIIEAGKPVEMLVTRGLPRDAVYAIDQGVIRSLSDIGGSPVGLDRGLSKTEIATARAMVRSMDTHNSRISRGQMSTEKMLGIVLKHREAIDFAIHHTTDKQLKLAPILAVVARAYYHVDRDRLAEFCRTLSTTIAESCGDHAAVLLAKVAYRDRSFHNGIMGSRVLYAKTQGALRAFLRREKLTKLYEVESELYPIPEDAE